MTQTSWQRVEEILRTALGHAASERTAFLDRACADEPAVRREVDSLLSADAHAEGFLETVVARELRHLTAETAATGTEADDESWIGQRVGAYRIAERVGAGGMSTVYLGVREDAEFEQRVAIKVIKRGMDSEDVERRFRQERQILASLDHPNIARLLDGGTAPNGQPFFILEYIQGLPIDRFCQTHALSTEARVRLFLTVCDAVQVAHRSLVVHRDIKPSNILVTQDGVAKLLDFGIAKLLAGPASDASTRRAERRLTPEYASPEQLRGDVTTTLSDVYSLGVLLYRLLTGQPPYRLRDTSPAKIEAHLGTVEIPLPSTAAVAGADPPSGEPAEPGQDAGIGRRQALAKRLRGDLDTIVMMALRLEPEERYPSVEQLASDLTRHLDGRPVRARRPTTAYRLGKWMRRHRPAVAAAALACTALAAGGVSTIWQARRAMAERARAEVERARAETERARAETERARAEIERDRAEQVARFLPELFDVVDPHRGRGSTVSARELLDSGAAKVTWQLADQPLLQARLFDTIGPIYQKLGLFDEAAQVIERALLLRREQLGPDHELIAQSLDHLGTLRLEQGAYDQAEPLLAAALTMRRTVLGEQHERVAESLNNHGELAHVRGDLETAAARFEEALARLPAGASAAHLRAAVLNNLAGVHQARGSLDDAEGLFQEALETYRQGPGTNSPAYASTLNNLALVRFRRGDLDQAEPLLRAALALRRSLLGDSHPEVAQSLNNLARVHYERGNPSAAEPLYREAVAHKRERLGDEHPSLAYSLHGLALVAWALGDRAEAKRLLHEAIDIRRRKLETGHPALADSLLQLGRLLIDSDRSTDALPHLREVVRIRQAELEADNPDLREATDALAEARAKLPPP